MMFFEGENCNRDVVVVVDDDDKKRYIRYRIRVKKTRVLHKIPFKNKFLDKVFGLIFRIMALVVDIFPS